MLFTNATTETMTDAQLADRVKYGRMAERALAERGGAMSETRKAQVRVAVQNGKTCWYRLLARNITR